MRASSLRKGSIVIYNTQPYRIMEAQHSTPGNLRARVQVKMRNLLNGNQTEVRYGATEDVEVAELFQQRATYLYTDAQGFHFMNNETYEQVAIPAEAVGDLSYYLQESMEISLSLLDGNPIGIELPATVVLTITETSPELKGATASNSPKPAITETGLQLTVPQFVKVGDRVSVNTADGTYISRA